MYEGTRPSEEGDGVLHLEGHTRVTGRLSRSNEPAASAEKAAVLTKSKFLPDIIMMDMVRG